MKLPKEKTYKQLIKELDSAYSKYIRQKDAELCAVCGQVLTSLPKDYEIHSPKAELNIPVGKWVEVE